MRKIKFRGRDFAGLWHIGDLIHNDDDLLIRNGCLSTYIKNETAGQFTEMLDKNGKEIYEGDILQEFCSGKTVLVVYEAPQFCYADNSFGYKFLNLPENYAVIGNIHDNPELLKGGNDE